jgi:amino acid transporter
MSQSEAVAADAIATALPRMTGNAMSVLVCISTLGAANGLIFTGSRISYAMGSDHALFSRLGVWSKRFGTPVGALVLQGALSLAIVLVAGSFIDTVIYTAPVFWLFILGTGVSVFVLRRKEPNITRPYKVSGYPVTTVIFCAACLFMLYNCITYALSNKPKGLLVIVVVLFAGALLYVITNARKRSV